MFQWFSAWIEEAMWLKECIDKAMLRWQRERQASARRRVELSRQVRPQLEILSARIVPATVNMYWDPTSGNNASVAANWDEGSLGGMHPAKAPGMTNGNTDNIYFDGTNGKGGNKSCTWDYQPTNTLGFVSFQYGWSQTVSFKDQDGFSVSSYSYETSSSSPTLAPNGTSSFPAITLKNGNAFNIDTGSKLLLTGTLNGGAVFFAGDGTAGEYLSNGGTVVYTGVVGGNSAFVDYLKIPVQNNTSGVFQVNGAGTGGNAEKGSVLQVSGADTMNTSNVSFYQNSSHAETDIFGNGTLWCVNDFKMGQGLLQTLDNYPDNLQVGTGGNQPVDGTAYLLGGEVRINPNKVGSAYGILNILGTTLANNPILDVGAATLNFKVNMTQGKNDCDQLIVGKIGGSGTPNFGYEGATTTVFISPQGPTTTGHTWQIIFFGQNKRTGTVTLDPPTGYKPPNWQPSYLEIDN